MQTNGDHLTRRRLLHRAGLAGGALGLAPLIGACGSAGSSTAAGGDDGDGPITVGFLTAFTGLETILGETQFNCFTLAVDEINKSGGVAGRKLKVVREDDGTETKQAIEKANKLALQDRASLIVGMISSLEREAVLSVTPRLKLPVMYTTYYEGAFGEATACDPYMVATGQVPNQQVDPLVPWLTKNVGKNVYVVGSDYLWPRGTTAALKPKLEAEGGKIVGEQYFPFGTTDFSRVFRGAGSSNADIIWVTLAGADFTAFTKQFDEFSPKARFVSPGMDDVFAANNKGRVVGGLASQAYFMSIDSDVNRKFVDAYHGRFGAGKPINAIGEATYDAVHLFKLAVEKAGGSTDPAKWIPALSGVEFEAPQGRVKIDPNSQHMDTSSVLGEIEASGSIKVVVDFGRITPVVKGCDNASKWNA